MSLPTQCQNCFKAHDFSRECFGSCSTCGKKDMCENCCYEHECLPGKGRQLRIITNPAWICNLVKTWERVEKSDGKVEYPKLEAYTNGNCERKPIKIEARSNFGYKADYLYEISAFLQKKIDSAEFRKFPKTLERLKNKQEHFMELYERAKIEEGNNKTKTCRKTQWLGYRPRLANKNDQRVFDRLSNRSETSRNDRRNNKV